MEMIDAAKRPIATTFVDAKNMIELADLLVQVEEALEETLDFLQRNSTSRSRRFEVCSRIEDLLDRLRVPVGGR